METTKIDPGSTVAEIQRILGLYSASGVAVEYENKEVSAVSFKIRINEEQEVPFRLPCRWKVVLEILQRRRRNVRDPKALEVQAKRVAWRQILRWIEAQLALVETSMVKLQEVFMPYLQVGINETLYDRIEQGKFKSIEYKKGDKK